jgi:hypothetical protein
MQQKESKTNWHFRISIIKSVIRICAGVALMMTDQWYLDAAGGLVVGAEILGILEEI